MMEAYEGKMAYSIIMMFMYLLLPLWGTEYGQFQSQ